MCIFQLCERDEHLRIGDELGDDLGHDLGGQKIVMNCHPDMCVFQLCERDEHSHVPAVLLHAERADLDLGLHILHSLRQPSP